MTGGGGGFKDWQDLRTHLIDTYGETPRPETEAVIINAYQLHPAALEATALTLTADVKAGTIRSGWAVLRSRAGSISGPPSNPARDTGAERQKKLNHAEQWVRAAGIHYDEPTEIEDELFGDRGQLRNYPNLKDHILDYWANHRPTGLRLEREADERAEAWKQTQTIIPPRRPPKERPL
jgi:hypothetical protein